VNELRDDAVVLRAYKSGESDRVVVLWTKSRGKVRAIAKGVRKPTSRIGSALEPSAHVDIVLVQGRGQLEIVKQVSHRSGFPTIRSDFDRLTAAMQLLEAVDATPAEGHADEQLFTMLVRALGTLDDASLTPTLVPAAFFLKMLSLDGVTPSVTACAECDSTGPFVAFDVEVGGLLCEACRPGRPLDPEAVHLLQRLVGGDLGAVVRERDIPGSAEVIRWAADALERHWGRRLRVGRSTPPT
jgi:DNA repair protein RecO (recombination protein O)